MKTFSEWLKSRDIAEDFSGGPTTVASANPVQQAPSPFGGVPPQLTQKLQSMGNNAQQVMQKANQAVAQGKKNMAQALQDAIAEFEQESNTQRSGQPNGVANQSQGVV